jgi:RNA polymerase sigma factor (sigma-70 family)
VPIFSENRALLEQFRNGQRAALAEVYRYYFDDVYRLAQYGFATQAGVRAASLPREADRLDFTQDVFVKAFSPSARSAYDGLRPYRPFLLQIARNLRIDQLRQAGREPSHSEHSLEQTVDIDALIAQNAAWPEARASDADLHWQRLLNETSSVLGSLAKDVQEIARLRFVEELSQADVAQRLGVTRRRVRTLESRLLGGVRRHLARIGLTPEEK